MSNTEERFDFICDWCGKDVMMKPHLDEDMDYIILDGPSTQQIQLCRTCYIFAIQGLMFAQEVANSCPTAGRTHGKRIYVAVEETGQESELVNVLSWPNHSLKDIATSVKRPSITYQVSPDL